MNILDYYRKFIKKSRSFFAKRRRVDIFLFAAAIVILVVVAVYQIGRKVDESKRVNITVSPQCIRLFGSSIVDALIREFEEQSPDLRIQVIQPLESGVRPDIIFFDDSEFGILINDSALASLAPYIHPETQAGHWALPLVSFMDIFIYNIDVLEAANLDRPPKTRAEFLTAARAVAGQESAFAFALGLNQADPMALRRDVYPWIWANGGDVSLVDASAGNPALPRALMDTIAFLAQLNREGLLAPDTFGKIPAQRLQEFAEGKIAMMTASARDLAFLRDNTDGITFGITALPMTTLGKNRLGLSGIYAGIGSECALPDEAWRFLAFIAGKKHILAEALNAVPGSFPDTFSGEYIVKDPLYSKVWDIFEAAEIVDYHPGLQNEDEINNLIREKLVEVFE